VLTIARAEDAARSRITGLRSDNPFVLRPVNPEGAAPMPHWHVDADSPARVLLAAGAAGPLGGDDLRLDVDVGPGAALVFGSVSAMLALPGPFGQSSRIETNVRVAENGTLVWLPKPMIAARNCDHHAITNVMLEPGARL